MKKSSGNMRTRVVVTAGPTREHLDPVRFLSNPSTGKMGFALAAAAAKAGYETILVAGPVSLPAPEGVERVDVVSARDMLAAVRKALDGGKRRVFISCAAVADFRPRSVSGVKLKKKAMSAEIKLVRNPDILKTVGSDMAKGLLPETFLVGFAAETGDALAEAARKCREKRLEFIVANDVTVEGAGFAVDTNKVSLVFKDGRVKSLPLMSKREIGRAHV